VKHARNIAIVLAIAAAVAFVPSGGSAANTVAWILTLIMYGALAWFVHTLYRSYRGELYGLGDRMRGLLYLSIGVATVAVVGTSDLWDTGAGTIVWFLLVGGASFGAFTVFSHWREQNSY
jgi:hypothetical protein